MVGLIPFTNGLNLQKISLICLNLEVYHHAIVFAHNKHIWSISIEIWIKEYLKGIIQCSIQKIKQSAFSFGRLHLEKLDFI